MASAWAVVFMVTRISIAALFFSSALHKVKNWNQLGDLVRTLAPMTDRAARPLGVVALVAEVAVLASVLAGGRSALIGFVGAMALVFLYTALQVSSLVSGREVECDCFELPGGKPAGISLSTIARNLLVMVVSLIGILGFLMLERIPDSGGASLWLSLVASMTGLVLAGSLVRLGHPRANTSTRSVSDH